MPARYSGSSPAIAERLPGEPRIGYPHLCGAPGVSGVAILGR